jgi:hypothetical protein
MYAVFSSLQARIKFIKLFCGILFFDYWVWPFHLDLTHLKHVVILLLCYDSVLLIMDNLYRRVEFV